MCIRDRLRFGQGVRAFLFDRVLCGEDEERLGQRVPLAADRHLTLLHRLQERRLRLWGRAIDLVREKDVGEHRTLQESEFALTCRAILMDDFGTGDVRRHEIRRELNAVEVESQASSQRVDQQRLGETRHAFENAVAASEDGDEELLDKDKTVGAQVRRVRAATRAGGSPLRSPAERVAPSSCSTRRQPAWSC